MLISGNASDALQAALKVENEAHPLTNNFTEKKTIMTAFDEPKKPEPTQLSFLDETPVNESRIREKLKVSPMDMPDEELDAAMDMEVQRQEKKIKQQNKMLGIKEKEEETPKDFKNLQANDS